MRSEWSKGVGRFFFFESHIGVQTALQVQVQRLWKLKTIYVCAASSEKAINPKEMIKDEHQCVRLRLKTIQAEPSRRCSWLQKDWNWQKKKKKLKKKVVCIPWSSGECAQVSVGQQKNPIKHCSEEIPARVKHVPSAITSQSLTDFCCKTCKFDIPLFVMEPERFYLITHLRT